MLEKKIKFTDFNGQEREQTFQFNLTKQELLTMELGTTGGYTEMLKTIINTTDTPKLMEVFEKFILKSYGRKSADGMRFEKSEQLSLEFKQTEAYSELFLELISSDEAAAKFINGVVPKEVAGQIDLKEIEQKLQDGTL